jgi:hypothetical protein
MARSRAEAASSRFCSGGQGEIMWSVLDYFAAMIAASIILIPLALGAGYEPPGGIHAYEPMKLINKLPSLHFPDGH